MRRLLVLALTGGLLATLVAACGGDEDPTAADGTAAPAPTTTVIAETAEPPVRQVTLDLVDPSRETPAGAGLPHEGERRLVTEVHVPAGTGPFPLIAFSHGLAGHPRKFTRLFRAWNEAGYLVAAPAFPRSNDEVPGEPTFADLPDQPGDISFVIDEVLAASAADAGPLAGLVDPERIGVAGLSLGGATTYGVAFNDCCLDERPRAALVLDGARLAVGGEFVFDRGLPLMIVHADGDYALPYADATGAYAAAVAPKYLVTLHEVAHAEPFENTPDPADDLVEAVTVAFWDRWLADDESAEERIVAAVTPPALATLERE